MNVLSHQDWMNMVQKYSKLFIPIPVWHNDGNYKILWEFFSKIVIISQIHLNTPDHSLQEKIPRPVWVL